MPRNYWGDLDPGSCTMKPRVVLEWKLQRSGLPEDSLSWLWLRSTPEVTRICLVFKALQSFLSSFIYFTHPPALCMSVSGKRPAWCALHSPSPGYPTYLQCSPLYIFASFPSKFIMLFADPPQLSVPSPPVSPIYFYIFTDYTCCLFWKNVNSLSLWDQGLFDFSLFSPNAYHIGVKKY